ISSLMHHDVEAADAMMSELSSLLRATLKTDSALKSELAHEIELLRSYLTIEGIRFGDKLHYKIDIPRELLECTIPSLILQPIVENAILHGVFPNQRTGMICIEGRRDGQRLVLSVSDNGEGFDSDHPREGIGLSNTRARLNQLYGDEQSIVLDRSEDGGAR